MKTFRFSLVALIATTLFTACSDEAVVEQRSITSEAQEISFRLQGGTPETRATATTLDNVDAFAVYGIDDVEAVNIFSGVTVARQEDGTYDYNPKKYYSTGASDAQFFAYSPVSEYANITGLPLSSASSYTGTNFEYEITLPDSTGGKTSQVDLLVAGIGVPSITSSPVNLKFKHALSRIFVKATNGLSETVVITGLKLLQLNTKGKITGTPNSSSPFEWTWAWSNQTLPEAHEYILAETGVAVRAKMGTPTLVTSKEQGMLVIPQSTTGDLGGTPNGKWDSGEFALEVTYDVANLIGEVAHVFFATPYTFAPGKQYAITIDFAGTDLIEINFTIDVTDFENVIDVI